jgi:hypothetical protein
MGRGRRRGAKGWEKDMNVREEHEERIRNNRPSLYYRTTVLSHYRTIAPPYLAW